MDKFKEELREAIKKHKGIQIGIVLGFMGVTFGAYSELDGLGIVTNEYDVKDLGGKEAIYKLAEELGLKIYDI